VTRFEGVAVIIGIFFMVGVAVGFLVVIAIPALVRLLAAVHGRDRLEGDGWDPPDIGPPRKRPPSGAEPDDRDDRSWWGDAG
jgi:hypothetical protein